MIQKSIIDSVAESNAVEHNVNVDTGLPISTYSPAEIDNIDFYDAAKRHKKRIAKKHGLGFKTHIHTCSSCGHSVCRCSDRLRREQKNGAEGMR